MDSDVAAARIRMMRVANTMYVMKNQNSVAASSPGFQQALEKSNASPDAAEPGSGTDTVSSRANVKALMHSESYRSASPVLAGASTPSSSDLLTSAIDGGESAIPRAEDYDNLDELVAAFGGLSSNPVKKEDWSSEKPEDWTDAQFDKRINDMNYRYSLLDEDRLPFGLTRPEEGIARSTDVDHTKFEQCDGGIMRYDYFTSGDRKQCTFIPVMEWRHVTAGGGIDPTVGDTYSMQTPFGFKVVFMRGSSGTPGGYSEDLFQDKVNSLLAEG